MIKAQEPPELPPIVARVLNRFGEVGSIDVRWGNHVTRFNPGADKTKYIHNVL